MLRRRLVPLLLGLVVTGAVLVGAANAVVLLGAGGSPAGRAQAALVLGALVRPDGTPSPMLRDRLAAAAALYREGRVAKVLASGDHGTASYDEVNAMRRELVRLGVPERDVFTDHAGFSTWDSVVRARRVFGVRSAVVVTNGFHVARAVWLARRAGLDASGLAADDPRGYGRQGTLSGVREVLARVKAVEEVVTGADPRFLGPPIPIEGDGRASRG